MAPPEREHRMCVCPSPPPHPCAATRGPVAQYRQPTSPHQGSQHSHSRTATTTTHRRHTARLLRALPFTVCACAVVELPAVYHGAACDTFKTEHEHELAQAVLHASRRTGLLVTSSCPAPFTTNALRSTASPAAGSLGSAYRAGQTPLGHRGIRSPPPPCTPAAPPLQAHVRHGYVHAW